MTGDLWARLFELVPGAERHALIGETGHASVSPKFVRAMIAALVTCEGCGAQPGEDCLPYCLPAPGEGCDASAEALGMDSESLWNLDALMSAILDIMPRALFDTDSSGEVTISTGWRVISSSDDLVPVGKVS